MNNTRWGAVTQHLPLLGHVLDRGFFFGHNAFIQPENVMRQPKVYNLPLDHLGTHETIVVVVDGVPQSVDTWNYTKDAEGNKTFFIEGVTTWQLHFKAGTLVPVIRQ